MNIIHVLILFYACICQRTYIPYEYLMTECIYSYMIIMYTSTTTFLLPYAEHYYCALLS